MAKVVRYRFVVDGELSTRALAAFPDLTRSEVTTAGTTTLYGSMSDSTAVREILARIDALGLTLIEMSRLPD
ncbi:hypothetical protein [Nocardia veterana]|uniref:Uncharacterized protein n=1 Tax=Nocardia veterana TaxID=132249 RepID=A0A7X6RG97_9NOCA|nr:hypothetical protein [Nocardia veterana]NKY84907.1 hypothetical protein [Nocardia veterana]